MPLADRLNSLPLILAGPILRRVPPPAAPQQLIALNQSPSQFFSVPGSFSAVPSSPRQSQQRSSPPAGWAPRAVEKAV